MKAADFPVLDRPHDDQTPGRVVCDEYGSLEPYLDEIDYWCSMPVRLVVTCGVGLHVEIGPYSVDPEDIELLRKAIAGYDACRRTERTL
jgi:hypothetical protein